MKKLKSSFLALAVLLLISIIPLNTEAAASKTDRPTGYQPLVMERMEPSQEELDHMVTKTYKNKSYTANKWDKYSSDYFYNQLNSRQKTLYNNIYNVCMDYLVNNMDARWDGNYEGYFTTYIAAPDGMTQDEAYTTIMLIMTNCPQFYFVDSTAGYSRAMGSNMVHAVCLKMYSDFASGANRRQATATLERKLETWTAQVNTKSSKVAREIEANNIICANTEYDYTAADMDPYNDVSTYHQSCAGVFLEGMAVCAGYAEAFQMLCRSADIEVITVTSVAHEWNLVNLYGNWYQVDTTWNDTADTDYYLNISDRMIADEDHTLEDWLIPLNVPKCIYDSVVKNAIYNGVNYGPIYDEDYYLAKYPDVARAYAGKTDEAIAHFVNYGMKEGRQGSANFDVQSYKRQYVDLRTAYGNNLKSYYLHYLNYGQKEGRKGTGCNTLQGSVTKLNGVDYSAVYNFNYYKSAYADINRTYGDDDIAALNHFVNYGMKEGRQASSNFNVTSYLYRYADLRKTYGNNLVSYYRHYMNYGRREGRSGTGCSTMQGIQTVYNGVDYSAVYNYNYYTGKYADIKRVYGYDDYKVLQHFVNYGMREGRQGANTFEVRSYYNRYSDLRRAYGTNWQQYYLHYVRYGKKEGRVAVNCTSLQNATTTYNGVNYASVYSYDYYIAKNPDVAKAFGGDENKTLQHFVNYGMREGRQGSVNFNVQAYANRYADLKKAYGNNWKSYYMHYVNYGVREGRNGK